MAFNSWPFVVFLPLILAAYWLLPHRRRWALLLAGSYGFYALASPAFLPWIALSTLVAYGLARLMAGVFYPGWRKGLLALGVVSNLGLLLTFKYLDFANEALRIVLSHFNLAYQAPTLNLLLPVGISFYTFQSVGYLIDVYRGQLEPETHLGRFALYMAFFPKLIAGPIERAGSLLPQFQREPAFDAARVFDGGQLVLWGLFKKVVIADRLAVYVRAVYAHPLDYAGWAVITATLFGAAQIYSDFSGYSDIAVGVARMFGLTLTNNFRQPYCASSVSEFWRRWHISLSNWFRDYLYIPLGGSRVPRWRRYLNLFLVFLVSGLWHGANWTFVLWGALHGLYVVGEAWTRTAREWIARRLRLGPAVRTVLGVGATLALVNFAWIFFQAPTVAHALVLTRNLFRLDLASDWLTPWAALTAAPGPEMALAWGLVGLLALVHLGRDGRLPLPAVVFKTVWMRWMVYLALALAIMNLGVATETPFIYAGF